MRNGCRFRTPGSFFFLCRRIRTYINQTPRVERRFVSKFYVLVHFRDKNIHCFPKKDKNLFSLSHSAERHFRLESLNFVMLIRYYKLYNPRSIDNDQSQPGKSTIVRVDVHRIERKYCFLPMGFRFLDGINKTVDVLHQR